MHQADRHEVSNAERFSESQMLIHGVTDIVQPPTHAGNDVVVAYHVLFAARLGYSEVEVIGRVVAGCPPHVQHKW
eukprot:5185325-Amphidinium_carterae.2